MSEKQYLARKTEKIQQTAQSTCNIEGQISTSATLKRKNTEALTTKRLKAEDNTENQELLKELHSII